MSIGGYFIFFRVVMEESSLLVQEYYKHPVRNKALVSPTVSRHEGNSLCGDDITVYLRIDNDRIVDYGYDGNCSMITSAAASMWGELFVGADISDVMERGYETIASEGFEVSSRRRRSAVIALLAVKNAILEYRHLDSVLDFDDVVS